MATDRNKNINRPLSSQEIFSQRNLLNLSKETNSMKMEPTDIAFQTTFQNIDRQLVTVETARMIRKWFLYMFQLSSFPTL